MILPIHEENDFPNVISVSETRPKRGMTNKRWKAFQWLEIRAFVSIVGLLVASLTIGRLHNTHIWGIHVWKWCLLFLVILCSRSIIEWATCTLEKNCLVRSKELFFVLRLTSLGLCVRVAFVFTHGVDRSHKDKKITQYVTRALISTLIACIMWLVKTLSIKLLYYNYHFKRYFKWIQMSMSHKQVILALLGNDEKDLTFRYTTNSGVEKIATVRVDKLKKMGWEDVSPWNMMELIEAIIFTGMSNMDKELGVKGYQCNCSNMKDDLINIDRKSRIAANKVYKEISSKFSDSDSSYIKIDEILPDWKDKNKEIKKFFRESESGWIKKSAFRESVVKVYNDRYMLIRSLNGSKATVMKLNRVASAIVSSISAIVFLLVMGFMTSELLVLVASQIVLLSFVFGNSAKCIFESIIFVFGLRPFCVGDRCLIGDANDQEELMVHKVNMMSTEFLTPTGAKVYFPNSELITKRITNLYRSPDTRDSLEFSVEPPSATESIYSDEENGITEHSLNAKKDSLEGATIKHLKEQIEEYLKSKPQHWNAKQYNLTKKDRKDKNTIMLVLDVNHAVNYLNNGDRSWRKVMLIAELKKILENSCISYGDELDSELKEIYEEVTCKKVENKKVEPQDIFDELSVTL